MNTSDRSEMSCELRVASCEKEGTLLEWATRKDATEPLPSDLTDAQVQELESLEKAWNWFGNMLENASDDDFRPVPSANPVQTSEKPVIPTASPKRNRLLFALSASVAVLMVIGAVFVNQLIQPSNNQVPIANNQSTDIISSDASTSSVQDELVWEEDDAYDDQLEALSNSMLNAAPGGTWEMTAMAECSVVGYEMSEWNDNSTF